MVTRLQPPLTSNGIPPVACELDEWLRRSGQEGKRHPLDPRGVCMSCGDQKFGRWQWLSEEPE